MENTNPGNPSLDFPQDFRCPISMELMKDPVTISTGVTYERKNIEKWFHIYKKKTCPATMQNIETLEITPNHTLKRLIVAWLDSQADHQNPISRPTPSAQHDELVAILNKMDFTPFKVSSLRKLRLIVETGDVMMEDFKKSGGVEILVKIIVQILVENFDFATLRACEEALGVLQQVPFSDDDELILERLMKPDCMKSMALILQRGSSEARLCAILIFQKMSKADYQWNYVAQDQGIDFFKSLLETALKAIEAGAICTLIELLRIEQIEMREDFAADKVAKLVALLNVGGGGGQGTTKDRVVKILKLHGGSWRRYPCFPGELKNYLGLGNDS
ncbi:hypothetical protein DH2020_023414 [Rehmannia glutinosa]|uniref:U-box domain-containing protein n=1 Tax=Rehmannia glutinosa TaxID=99300 RepID=A0ABR0W8J9_REHGL